MILVGIGVVLVLSPQVLIDNVHLGVAPTWSDFALGIAVGMIAYTGIETISNMAEEAKDASRTIPRRLLAVVAVLGLYLLIPVVALSAMPVTETLPATTRPRSAPSSPTTRSSASSRTSASATAPPKRCASTSACSPR